MLFGLSKKRLFLASLSLLTALAVIPGSQAKNSRTNSGKKQKNNRYYLVPPPPPYVPSMLPELTHSSGYGQGQYQSYYSHASRASASGPIIYKPNKYLTYYFHNKG